MRFDSHPNDGVGPKTWSGSAIAGWTVMARPANPIVMRFYRSREGYTYTEPRSVIGMSPVSEFGQSPLVTYDPPGWLVKWPATTPPNVAYFNYAAVIVKRVNATTWLELRWNALSHARTMLENSSVVSPPYAFELWCSHNASGTLATTRLAVWDYQSVAGATAVNVPFDPKTTPMYVEAMILDNVVTWALWSEYPGTLAGPAADSSKVESGSYAIPAALQSVIGSGVAGQPGASLFVHNADTDSFVAGRPSPSWYYTALNPPFIHYLEFIDASWPGNTIDVPVIGDAEDTLPTIRVKGLITDPVIVFRIPTDDGSYESSRIAIDGTINAGEEIIIDLASGGSVVDAAGNSRYGMLRPGSRLPVFRPGINKVTLIANTWDATLPEHMSVSWRDALI
jgi:hypothetical protein